MMRLQPGCPAARWPGRLSGQHDQSLERLISTELLRRGFETFVIVTDLYSCSRSDHCCQLQRLAMSSRPWIFCRHWLTSSSRPWMFCRQRLAPGLIVELDVTGRVCNCCGSRRDGPAMVPAHRNAASLRSAQQEDPPTPRAAADTPLHDSAQAP